MFMLVYVYIYLSIFFIKFQNMAFQAEQKIKSKILTSLGTDQLFRLLSDHDVNVLMKTLGLLRNLLSNKPVSTRSSMLTFHMLSIGDP